jgi:hypothetical protein
MLFAHLPEFAFYYGAEGLLGGGDVHSGRVPVIENNHIATDVFWVVGIVDGRTREAVLVLGCLA